MDKHIKKPKLNQGKIPDSALMAKDEPEYSNPVFSFIHSSDNHCLLCEWKKSELKELINAFKIMESLKWSQLPASSLHFRKVEHYVIPLPNNVSQDETIFEVSIDNEKKRLFGYRVDNIFRILWFDREHSVAPYHKTKKAR
jgi:hypothetical protein